MAQIGSFTAKDGKYTGTIRTMTINVKAQLVPNTDKVSDSAPDFRLYAGCLLYTSPSPRDRQKSRMPSSA